MTSPEIAAALREIATYLELDGDRFRAGAYRKAAGTVDAAHDLEQRISRGTVGELPNIGASISGVIEALYRREPLELLERLRQAWPKVVVELAELPGIGVAKARGLHRGLAPTSLEDVAAACAAGRVRALKGFGPGSETKIAEAIARHKERGPVVAHFEARELGDTWLAYLGGCPAIARATVAGPGRRRLETADHIALAVATDDPDAVAAHVRRHPQVSALEVDGNQLTARLLQGPRLVVTMAARPRFGLAAVLATGSPTHVELLARRAIGRGVDLGGLDAADEEALYRALALPPIPPELRDGSDEVELAERGELDGIVRAEQVRGAIHCHTLYSDGKNTIEEMARAAEALGLDYITITDHSITAGYAGGLDRDRLLKQWDEIAEVQEKVSIRLLRGSEVDILADGALDFADEVLERMDVVIASIHQRHKLDAAAMTARVCRAMRHPLFKIWGHPLGRLLLQRDPIELDLDAVFDAIAESPAVIEVSGDPHRMDLDPARVIAARKRGLRFVLSTDAHSVAGLAYLDNAVASARRARLTPGEILNTLPVDQFIAAVRPRGAQV